MCVCGRRAIQVTFVALPEIPFLSFCTRNSEKFIAKVGNRLKRLSTRRDSSMAHARKTYLSKDVIKYPHNLSTLNLGEVPLGL